jgi:hypothetical protein
VRAARSFILPEVADVPIYLRRGDREWEVEEMKGRGMETYEIVLTFHIK